MNNSDPKRTLAFTVMTYNIYGSSTSDEVPLKWSHRQPEVVRQIEAHSPDVLGLQEAFRSQIDDIIKQLPDYRSIGVGRETGREDGGREDGEYAAILYRKERFDVERSDTFWFSETPQVASRGGPDWGNPTHKRICTWAHLIEKKTDQAFYFYNLHLEQGSRGDTARKRSVQLLGERIGARAHPEDLFVVVGDFNAPPVDEAIVWLVRERGYRDTYAETHKDSSDNGHTFCNWEGSWRLRIDYIFSTPEASVVSSFVSYESKTGRRGSDHYPLITELQLPVKPSGE